MVYLLCGNTLYSNIDKWYKIYGIRIYGMQVYGIKVYGMRIGGIRIYMVF